MSKHDDSLTIRAIKIALGDNGNGALEWADEYGEPGYSNPEKSILFANWNEAERTLERRWLARLSPNPHEAQCANRGREAWRRLEKRLEAQGYKLEWSDEWYVDGGRSPCRAYRTSPDSHGWEPRVRACDGYMLTPEDDAGDWIEEARNHEDEPLPSWFDDSELERRGYEAIDQNDKEVGFYGRTDAPHKFMPGLIQKGFDVVLQLTGRGQFHVRYKIWTRKEAERGLLFDGASGIHIPQRFAREADRSCVTGVSEEHYAILEAGVDHDLYWDAWDEVLKTARMTRSDGIVVSLEQDGDVFYRDVRAEYCEYEDKWFINATAEDMP